MVRIRKTGFVGKNRLQGKNDCKAGGIWYDLFLAPNIKHCRIVKKFGVLDKHKTIKGFTNISDKINRKEYFNMGNGGKLIAKVPWSWKKSFSQSVVIPHKMKICNECTRDILCDECDKLVNEKKDF